VKLLLNKLGKRSILQLATASGAAADNIKGFTMHSCLGLKVNTKPGKRRFAELKREWQKKKILIIDSVTGSRGYLRLVTEGCFVTVVYPV
jgi:hypothetical protein